MRLLFFRRRRRAPRAGIAAAAALALLIAAACARNKPYDGAPNYDEPGCTAAGGKVELPPESATQTDGGFQSFLDQGCAMGIFLGYAIVQGTNAPEVGLCCSM